MSVRSIILRSLLFWAVLTATGYAIVFLVAILGQLITPGITDLQWRRVFVTACSGAGLAIGAVGMVAVGCWLARRLGMTVADVGLGRRARWADVGLGSAVGLVSYALAVGLAAVAGWATIEWNPFDALTAATVAVMTILFAAVAVIEEMLFRGLPFAMIARRSPAVAVIVTSILFTLFHLGNSGFDAAALIGLFVVGVVLGIARLRTGSLWLVIGWHLTWNLTQSAVFGCAVSGEDLGLPSLLATTLDGPALWVGGDFGLESGLLAVIVVGLSLVAIDRIVGVRRLD